MVGYKLFVKEESLTHNGYSAMNWPLLQHWMMGKSEQYIEQLKIIQPRDI
jgi:hypothetical protein